MADPHGDRRARAGGARRAGLGLGLGLVLLGLGVSAAEAATIYRCGPAGRVYSQTPCAQGEGERLEHEGEVSGARQAEALAVARREAATARALARRRGPAPDGPTAVVIPRADVSLGSSGAPRPAAPRRPRDFTAKVPKAPKAAKAP